MCETIVKFEEEVVKNYLDNCIKFWRLKTQKGDEVAPYYVDAFQSVRVSLFGKLLKEDDKSRMN